jgi:hypothetical protein
VGGFRAGREQPQRRPRRHQDHRMRTVSPRIST